MDESRARVAVARALGEAIHRSERIPGTPRWRSVATAITERVLTEPLDLPPGQTLAGMVTTERVARWIDASRHPTLASWRSGVANRLLHPILPPVDAAETVAPLTWLLNRRIEDGGTPLTATNNLARATVLEAAERFGWRDWDRAPRSAGDVHQLIVLRDTATQMRFVRRQAGRLHATARGAELAHAPEEPWRGVETSPARISLTSRPSCWHCGSCKGVLEADDLANPFGPVVLPAGWQTKDGPLSDRDLSAVLCGPIRWWRPFSVLEEQPSTSERNGQATDPPPHRIHTIR